MASDGCAASETVPGRSQHLLFGRALRHLYGFLEKILRFGVLLFVAQGNAQRLHRSQRIRTFGTEYAAANRQHLDTQRLGVRVSVFPDERVRQVPRLECLAMFGSEDSPLC